MIIFDAVYGSLTISSLLFTLYYMNMNMEKWADFANH